ncbi:MAG: phosphatase PAP2 family protein [Phycisphaerales bacterium]
MTASRGIRQDYFFDSERKSRVRSRLAFASVLLLGLVLTHILDNQLFKATYVGADQVAFTESRAWYQILRQVGDARSWLIVAAAGVAHAFWRAAQGQGTRARLGAMLAIFVGPVLGGLCAELLRAVLSRERPLSLDGTFQGHVWDVPFSGVYSAGRWFDVSNLGLPSSHAAVAMAGAIAAARAFPGSGWILVPVAVGCGWTRMLSGRHFSSDVFLGLMVGWVAGNLAAALLRRIR